MSAPPATAAGPDPATGHLAVGTADTPPVTLLADPDDSPACRATLTARHDLDHGVVVCLPQPGAVSTAALGTDLLVVLGKSTASRTGAQDRRRAWELAGRWLAAERVTDLVVLGAHRLPVARWTDLTSLTATSGSRLWLVVHGAGSTDAHRAAVATARQGRAPDVRPWPNALATLPHPDTTGDDHCDDPDGYPMVPDVEFTRFRATARRLLPTEAFARADAVYRDTVAQARTHADDLRLSLLTRVSHAELVDAVLQQLTIEATSAADVLTRVRAAQAGLFGEGLFVDLRPQPMPTWRGATVRLEPRLDPATVARLRSLADPATAAVVLLCRATGLPAMMLCRLHAGALTEQHGGLHVRLTGMLGYQIPARAVGILRSVLPPVPIATGDAATPAGAGWLFAGEDGVPLDERALTRLRDQGAAHAGVTLPAGSFRTGSVTDMRGLPGIAR